MSKKSWTWVALGAVVALLWCVWIIGSAKEPITPSFLIGVPPQAGRGGINELSSLEFLVTRAPADLVAIVEKELVRPHGWNQLRIGLEVPQEVTIHHFSKGGTVIDIVPAPNPKHSLVIVSRRRKTDIMSRIRGYMGGGGP